MPKYSKAFKLRMVQRLMGPPAMSAKALSKEVGISHSALSAWLHEAGTLDEMTRAQDPDALESVPTTTPARSEPRGPHEQLRLLALASTLSGDELGAMLRREGVHAAELDAWRSAALEALRGRSAVPATSAADRKRIQQLERELARKEKALAEAAALLMLQKNYPGRRPTCGREAPGRRVRYDGQRRAGRSGRLLFGDLDPVKKHGPGTAMDLAVVTPPGDPV